MTTISIIGGGRWARAIAGVLTALPDAPEKIIMHSRNNVVGIQAWIAERELSTRVDVVQEWPNYEEALPNALIIANRAADHLAAAIPALAAGVAVLVEKPMALDGHAVRQLQNHATAGSAMLAASHVFLFARYLENFSAAAPHELATGLEFLWEDGQADVVRGEAKSYDPAVPVFDDILPHVLPMLTRLARHSLALDDVMMECGGAKIVITARAGGLPVIIRLKRNGQARRRILTMQSRNGPCILDFSTEPGTIALPGKALQAGDLLWNSAPRPLAAMLEAFLAAARSGRHDARLSPDAALASAVFADGVRGLYRTQLRAWLACHSAADAARAYALQEMSSQA